VISERADHSYEREQKLQAEIEKLQAEVQEWKTRYAKAKTTIRSIRHSSMGLQVPSSGLLGQDGNLVDPRGLIKAVHLTKFQISIDELLRIARGMNFAQSLEHVKSVVVATRALTQEVGDENEEISRIKQRVSATANNLTTAAKNHAGGHGLSPVSLLDAAASHLTASVIELVRLVKIRPTTSEDALAEEDEYLASAVTQIDEDAMTFSQHDDRFLPVGAASISGHDFPQPPSNGNPGLVKDARFAENRQSNDSVYSIKSAKQRNRSRNGSSMLGEQVGSESKNWVEAPSFVRNESNVEELRVSLNRFPMPPLGLRSP
jgi:cell division septum initiation protein DivIVA